MSEEEGNGKLLRFPCDFPLKVMGRDERNFEDAVLAIFERHLGDLDGADVTSRPSSSGNFLSITVVFRAESQDQLDALYRDLTDHEQVLFCL